MVAQGAPLGVQGVEDGGRHADHALAMRYENAAVPGQEELPVGSVPASAPAPEESCLLHTSTVSAQINCTIPARVHGDTLLNHSVLEGARDRTSKDDYIRVAPAQRLKKQASNITSGFDV